MIELKNMNHASDCGVKNWKPPDPRYSFEDYWEDGNEFCAEYCTCKCKDEYFKQFES
jgi:hypothetical protein